MKQFKLLSKPLGSVERLVIECSDGCALEILLGWGAGLNAWRIPINEAKTDFRELLYGYRDEETFWQIQADTSAGERLAPWPGRTNNAVWQWKNRQFQLENNVSWAKHALHGLLHTKRWKFLDFKSDAEKAELRVGYDWTGNHPGFPFPFRAETTFVFTGESFAVKSLTKNTGSETMPYAEGWHPYFSLGAPIDACSLKLPASNRVLVDARDIPTGEQEKETRFDGKNMLKDLFVNDCFFIADKLNDADAKSFNSFENPMAEFKTVLKHGAESLTISQKGGTNGFRYIQVYTPPDRKSIAIEPMTHEPDVLNHHRLLTVLDCGEELMLEWSASFKRE